MLGTLGTALILACGAVASPSGSATSPAPSTAQARAPLDLTLVEAVFPKNARGDYIVCGSDGNTSACPYTNRLKSRLAAAKVTLCRCQNPAPDRAVSIQGTPSGGRIVVIYGIQQFELTVVNVAGSWLVDDETCLGGGADSSIYESVSPCGTG